MDPSKLASEALVARIRETGDERLRDYLVERHRALVNEVARALKFRLPQSVDEEDLCNAGFSGFLRAIETFDASKGRGFASYLRQRVHGSMLDELRAMDWLPRLMRSRLTERDRVAADLGQELGRDASDEEVAARLGLAVDVYRRSYPAKLPLLSSGLCAGVDPELDRIDGAIVGLGPQGRQRGDEQHPLTPLYQRELVERIRELLSDTEWALVELHYFEGLTLRLVAERLTLSPARVCQIHGAVLQRLKERLREEAPTV